LTVDPGSIDINIHPTKTEVKFDDEHTLYAILRSTVKHSLGQFNVVPALDFEHDQNLETPYSYKNRGALQPKVTVDSGFNPFQDGPQNSAGARTYKKQRTEGWENLYVGLESKVGKENDFSSLKFESETITGSIFAGQQDSLETIATTFQLRRKYIVTTIKSGMMVIDQSRAHQRVLYEQFLKNITVNEAVSQQLLFPLSLSFSKSDIDVLKEIKESLTTIGFVFSKVDGEEVKITGVPLMVAESEVGIVLDQLISDFQLEITEESFSQTDVLAKTLAKTLAVKTGEVLNNTSQQALVNDLFACKETRVSPFNKPVFVTITENDIDKKFI
jgi:DNA mismatch repair protein MutL